MKKVSRLFAGFAAIALCAACSNEEPVDGGKQPVGGKPTHDTAYMRISISDVNDSPVGRSSDLGGYEDGVPSEHNVHDAKFFLFDDNGIFVYQAQMTNPGFIEDNPADENIEYVGTDHILVVDGLTEKGWPTHMITVLNAPDFTPESTIAATAEKLANYKQSLDGKDGKEDYMVMSTSSYFSATTDKNHDNAYPYATKLDTSDFYTTPELAQTSANSVKIYVERLAVKVQLAIADEIANKSTYTDKEGKTHVIYKLTQTVAGDPNNEENPSDKATTDLYIEVLGWNLSATANKAHMSKQLSAAWASTAPFQGGWDNPDYFRSFWAKSAVYGTTAANVTGSTDADALGLVYTTFGTNSKTLGGYDYCNENTNDADHIFATNNNDEQSVLTAQTTHVVLKTRVCDKDGNDIDLVNYHGVLYLESAYIQYVLDKIQNGNIANLNFYTKLSDDSYKQVGPDFFDLKLDGSGNTAQVTIIVKDETATLYSKDSEGKMSDGSTSAALMESLKGKLAANQPDATSTYHATSYREGNVYYIPVEHKGVAANKGKEGYYGVVRNHWYRLNITSFSKVGFGVFNPDEVLIPQGPQDPLYYLGVDISILSWKIVNQNVEL